MKPTVLSLFSGIGGFDLGLERAGFEVVGQAENDPFCNSVLAAHWPEVPRYGDVRSVGESTLRSETNGDFAPTDDGRRQARTRLPNRVDLICGGFPCQDLSVAGKRAGLSGSRSSLWFEFHRILSELRPAFCLIENVHGLLSSNEGRDFGIILNGLGELWPSVGWAVLDSQHFGVPQRRRRVYIVGGPTGESVQQILSLCEGGDWHPQKGREAGEDVAYALNAGVRGTGDGHGNAWNSNYVANPLGAKEQGWRGDLDNDTYVLGHQVQTKHQSDYETETLIVRTDNTKANGRNWSDEDVAYTLDQANGQAVAFQQNTRDEVRLMGGDGRYAGALSAEPGMKQQNYIAGASVRRLTPVECERLQGFPDDWTKLADKTPDGLRYRALGNAVTVPVIEYLGLRILNVLREDR